MMYHAESFANAHFRTYLVGYAGSTPIPSLERLNVQLVHLSEMPTTFKSLPFLLLAPLKIAVQVTTILYAFLVSIPHPPEYIMVQNPPSIPTLALVSLVCRLRGSKLIIDWHNLGYSILALRLGNKHLLVRIAKTFEEYFGRSADIHLFVTEAMRKHLVKEWDLQGVKAVLHDRPPSYFRRAEVFETHDLFNKLGPSLSSGSLAAFFPLCLPPHSTPLTHLALPGASPGSIALDIEAADSFVSVSSPASTFPALRTERPALLVSSTSWTPDEDFALLLSALGQYERRARAANEVSAGEAQVGETLPKLLALVTGKGPLKAQYMAEVARLERDEGWRWVRCRSLWLAAEDYPILLGSADLGVCLHSSSSALDLPMKVVDMFGCGLPVCALDFKCLPELVKDGQNGLVFHSTDELAEQLARLLRGFPHAPALDALRKSFARSMARSAEHHHHLHGPSGAEGARWQWCSWAENWDRVLKPLVLTDVDRDQAALVH
ncbi:beta-1,4-mannosyltransferase [Phellopilus nigrolimitatus]|nr:beta-1,4-mannosyltransferase [Phellopilus nigrolimitatus]